MLPRIEPSQGHVIVIGDALEAVREMPGQSVHMVCTSPPYFNLRDYQTGYWEGGSPLCEHVLAKLKSRYDYPLQPGTPHAEMAEHTEGTDAPRWMPICPDCGAIRVDQQIGLEQTSEEYIAKLVMVFREVRRVMRSDGLCFVNLGDSYSGSGRGAWYRDDVQKETYVPGVHGMILPPASEVPAKNLMLIWARAALAFQADGWIIRDIVIWHKINPMTTSASDRFTMAWEAVIMMARNDGYFFDGQAVAEDAVTAVPGRRTTRNMRNVWRLASEPTRNGHFASFPSEIPKRAILVGTSERGCCPKCGAGWGRVVEKFRLATRPGRDTKVAGTDAMESGNRDPQRHVTHVETIGWYPRCKCYGCEPLPEGDYVTRQRFCEQVKNLETVPAVVFDPFTGSATTQATARRLGRNSIGCELNDEYARKWAATKIVCAFDKLPPMEDDDGQKYLF